MVDQAILCQKVLGVLPLDETIHIPSVLDELITSPDKFLKTSRTLKTLGPRLGEGGGRGLPIMAYAGRPPERGTFFRLQEYERCGFNKLKYMKGSEARGGYSGFQVTGMIIGFFGV